MKLNKRIQKDGQQNLTKEAIHIQIWDSLTWCLCGKTLHRSNIQQKAKGGCPTKSEFWPDHVIKINRHIKKTSQCAKAIILLNKHGEVCQYGPIQEAWKNVWPLTFRSRFPIKLGCFRNERDVLHYWSGNNFSFTFPCFFFYLGVWPLANTVLASS